MCTLVYFVTGQSVLSVVGGDTNNGRESLLVCVYYGGSTWGMLNSIDEVICDESDDDFDAYFLNYDDKEWQR